MPARPTLADVTHLAIGGAVTWDAVEQDSRMGAVLQGVDDNAVWEAKIPLVSPYSAPSKDITCRRQPPKHVPAAVQLLPPAASSWGPA